jgi:3-deoxy-D-manno-octulosonate 8-phosphate phosphatase (KDO 8-P phosphatase)
MVLLSGKLPGNFLVPSSIPKKSVEPLFNEYVLKHHLADYTTGSAAGNGAVRETCELMIGLNGNYEQVITDRKNYSETYSDYLAVRKSTIPVYYTSQDSKVIEVSGKN